jgi:hypothetical protein
VAVIEVSSRQLVVQGFADKVQCLWYFCLNDFLFAYAPECGQAPLDKTEGKIFVARRQLRVSRRLVEAVHWLHKCLGHAASSVSMTKCLREGAWRGVPLNIDDSMVQRVLDKVQCLACKLGQTNKLPMSQGTGMTECLVGEEFSVDAIVKVNPVSIRGFTGYYVFKELSVGYLFVVLFKTHDAENLVASFKEMYLFFRSHGHRPKQLRFDAGRVENSRHVYEELSKMEVETSPAAVEQQNQNPVERDVQTVKKGVSSMMIDQSSLSASYWCFGISMFIDARNCVINFRSGY